jgi:hypothetical protein
MQSPRRHLAARSILNRHEIVLGRSGSLIGGERWRVSAFEFVAQAEDHPDEVRPIGMLRGQPFEFGDEVAENARHRPRSKLHAAPPGVIVFLAQVAIAVAAQVG